MARRRSRSFHFFLNAETRQGIFIVFLFTFGTLLLFSMMGWAGSFGKSVDEAFAFLFGWDRMFAAFFILLWGYYLLEPDYVPLRMTNVLGMLLFFIALNPFVHTISFLEAGSVTDTALRAAGGRLGEVIAAPLIQSLGTAGTALVTLAVFLISLLLLFHATVQQVMFALRWAVQGIGFLVHTAASFVRNGLERRQQKVESRRWQEQSLSPASVNASIIHPSSIASSIVSNSVATTTSVSTLSAKADEETEPPKPRKRYPRVEIPLDLLERRDQRPGAGDIAHNREVIRRTLEKFGIPVEMHEVAVGPTVTQFSLKPSDGIKLSKITTLHNDLALALAAHPIRIEAPIPGKSLVGIEVPNQSVATVGLRELLESREFRERKSSLSFATGKDVSGKPWVSDLSRMPHLLVAGATGSGKSVCLNTIILSLLYTNGPDDVKFVMVDPKRVELQIYNGIPHLATLVITKVQETVNALKWALREMDRRYDLLSKFGARDLVSYNARVQDHLPYLVIIIDELADLMAVSSQEVEGPIVRLAQMARAVGIHLVLSTQRPSVDVITGLIKANIPARIAFAVASATDSRTILDQQGAEKLLGRGDMLFTTAELAVPKRLQGCFVSEQEIQRVVDHVKGIYEPADYDFMVTERSDGEATSWKDRFGENGDEDSDPLLEHAKEEILRAGKVSATFLQRRLKIGYARAARILDLLEQEGFVSPGDHAKPREILKADFASRTEESVGNEEWEQEKRFDQE